MGEGHQFQFTFAFQINDVSGPTGPCDSTITLPDPGTGATGPSPVKDPIPQDPGENPVETG